MTWPGEALLIKLWETITERGIGGLLTPWQIRREALAYTQAKQIEIVGLADAEIQANEIRSGRLKLADSPYALALPRAKGRETKHSNEVLQSRSVAEVATAAIIADTIRREVNVAKAIVFAESTLKDDPQTPPDRNVDPDWLYRWRDYAGAVSSEELQSLWGRLLAGELKSPGSFSYRTLDFIRNLSTDEANKIALLSRFVITTFIARDQTSILMKEGISMDDLLEMKNLGLLSGVEAVALSVTLESDNPNHFQHFLRSHGRGLLVTHDDPKMKIRLGAFIVSTLGQQVLRLGKFEPHEEYLRAVGNYIKKNTTAAKVRIGNYRHEAENKSTFSPEATL
jgi:hypothetical protein